MTVLAVCHVHSEWSYDAKWPLRDLAHEFTGRGYRVILSTEHDRGFSEERLQKYRAACAEASSPELLVVPGIEYSDPNNVVHILTWGLNRFLGEGLPTSELLAKVKAENGIAVMAHPARREAWKVYDRSWANYLTGIELWNRKCDGWAPSQVAPRLLDGTGLVPFASLDFHQKNQLFPLAMQLDLSAVSEDAVVKCIADRECRPLAFSAPVETYAKGWRRPAVHSVERMRRTAAPFYRWLKHFGKG